MDRVKKELYPDDKEAIDALPCTIKGALVLKQDVAALHGKGSWEEFLQGSSSRKTKMYCFPPVHARCMKVCYVLCAACQIRYGMARV